MLQKTGKSSELNFFIAKGGFRRLDNCVRGDRGSFIFFTFADVMASKMFDMAFNTLFCALSSVFTQVTGTPIRGFLSAQLASLVLIARELRATTVQKQALSTRDWVRYRDNFVVLLLIVAADDGALPLKVNTEANQAFGQVFGMELQFEQWGPELDFLNECTISAYTLSTQTMTHPHVSNTQQMIASYIPNEMRACAHYRLDGSTARQNVSEVEALLTAMNYPPTPPTWWIPLIRKHVQKWGL